MVKRNPKDSSISLDVFVEIVKEKCYEILRQTEDYKSRREIFWTSKELFLEDSKGFKIRSLLCYDKFKPNKTHYFRLFPFFGMFGYGGTIASMHLGSVEVYEDKVSVFDTGPGMDGSDENSIVKWGKMGASVHRTSKKLAIGGKPPYLTVMTKAHPT
ncbi:hypothetical protein BVRB_3g051860 [Beta vulgaris subsp. vulgaris]|nr:hypothetical protein BVRB_3g051860 [Beta vulgaris subsp. vulgaris]